MANPVHGIFKGVAVGNDAQAGQRAVAAAIEDIIGYRSCKAEIIGMYDQLHLNFNFP